MTDGDTNENINSEEQNREGNIRVKEIKSVKTTLFDRKTSSDSSFLTLPNTLNCQSLEKLQRSVWMLKSPVAGGNPELFILHYRKHTFKLLQL